MDDSIWSDARLRAFVAGLRASDWRRPVEDEDRDAFVRAAAVRVVPEVRMRILAEVGATIDPTGAAHVAYEVLEREAWSRRWAWLLVTPRPWDLVIEQTVKEIRSAYRSSEPGKADRRALAGMKDGAET